MNKKIDYRDAELCRNLSYEDMSDMTLEDAIYIVQSPVIAYHAAKTENDRMWLPRARMIRAFELLLNEVVTNSNKKEGNIAICKHSDKHFTVGKEYECTDIYVKYETPMVGIVDDHGELINADVNDTDFQFILN
jgi:hypothetical protein